MPRLDVQTQEITRAGLAPALALSDSVEGDVIDSGAVALYVDNGSGVSVTVTVLSPITVAGLSVEDPQIMVPAGATVLIGPWPKAVFGRPVGDPDEGRVYVDYSADVNRAVVSF